jgi:hypothetical protein
MAFDYIFNCDCGATTMHRPNGMERLTYLEGHHICDGCACEVAYHNSNVSFIKHKKGNTLYNFHDVAIRGKIYFVDIHIKNSRFTGSVAQNKNGWAYGYSYMCKDGGGGSPLMWDQEAFPTQEEAERQCLLYSLEKVKSKHPLRTKLEELLSTYPSDFIPPEGRQLQIFSH